MAAPPKPRRPAVLERGPASHPKPGGQHRPEETVHAHDSRYPGTGLLGCPASLQSSANQEPGIGTPHLVCPGVPSPPVTRLHTRPHPCRGPRSPGCRARVTHPRRRCGHPTALHQGARNLRDWEVSLLHTRSRLRQTNLPSVKFSFSIGTLPLRNDTLDRVAPASLLPQMSTPWLLTTTGDPPLNQLLPRSSQNTDSEKATHGPPNPSRSTLTGMCLQGTTHLLWGVTRTGFYCVPQTF